jgi:hypothetical protein
MTFLFYILKNFNNELHSILKAFEKPLKDLKKSKVKISRHRPFSVVLGRRLRESVNEVSPGVGGEGGEYPGDEADEQGSIHRQDLAPAPPHVLQGEHDGQEPAHAIVQSVPGTQVGRRVEAGRLLRDILRSKNLRRD